MLIDFGLAFQSTLVEDKAVDLYVLGQRILNLSHYSREYCVGIAMKWDGNGLEFLGDLKK